MRRVAGLCLLILILITACSQGDEQILINFFNGKDRSSPTFLEMKAFDENTLVLIYDEPIIQPKVTLSPQFEGYTSSVFENKLFIHLPSPLSPMEKIRVRSLVCDKMGNTTSIEGTAYGKNFEVPKLLINEFTTKGSKNNPDKVEIKVLSEGNLAGVTFYNGMYNHFDFFYTFESLPVHAGDYIVLQFQSPPEEPQINTFFGGEEGLGSNNGVLSLYASPNNEIIDAVVYSNRSNDSDTEYGGFGTRKVYEMVQELAESNQWENNGHILPELVIRSENSTATRSFNRLEGREDTNSSDDWYIVATRESSFGYANSTNYYQP